MWRSIKLLLAAVAMMAVLCSGAWAEPRPVPEDLVWTSGEYVLDRDITKASIVLEAGTNVTLRLNDGFTLLITHGIRVEEGCSLTIEGGQDVTTAGRLEVHQLGGSAAIGSWEGRKCGKITINGGTVIASTPGSGAAIGCGEGGSGGELVVNGGTVYAYATGDGHGIGGGPSSDTLKLRCDRGGQAWIVATDVWNVDNSGFNGVIFNENSCTVDEKWTGGITFVELPPEGSQDDRWYEKHGPSDHTFDRYAYFFGRVYGNATIKGRVEFPADLPKSALDVGLRGASWVLHIPERNTLEIAPGAALEMKQYGFVSKTMIRNEDTIDNKGRLVINGVWRSRYNPPDLAFIISSVDNVTGSGIFEADNGQAVFRYLANDLYDNRIHGRYAWSTTVEPGFESPTCGGWAEPLYAASGTDVRLFASPDVGWEFHSWESVWPKDLRIANDTFTMPDYNALDGRDVKIRALFDRGLYTIKVSPVDGGGTASPSKHEAYYDDDITLSHKAAPGYVFDRWEVLKPEGLAISGNTFKMPGTNVEIVAVFMKQRHGIDIGGRPIGGSVDVSPREAASGDVVTLWATPDNGYEFDGWEAVSPAGLSIGQDGRFTMPNQSVTVRPTFSALPPAEYAITVQSAGHGSAAVSDGRSSAVEGTQITLTHSADLGYEFDKWVGSDGLSISGNSFNMPNRDVVVQATFRKLVHSITVEPGVFGSATPSRPSASSDDVVTLTPRPIDGYLLDSWDTEPKGLVISDGNQFNMPNAPVKVRPIFAPLPLAEHAIVVGNDGNGTGTPDPASAKSGDKVTLAPTPNDGYVFERWDVVKPASDLVISDDGTFEMPDADVVINAIFREIPASPTAPAVTMHNVDCGGKGTASPNRAAAGTEITLKPYAKDGYVFDRWVVLAPQGLVISGDKFKMPSSDVSIVAVFKDIDELQSSSQTQTPLQVQGLHTDAIVPDKSDGILSSSAGQDMTIYLDVDFSKFTGAVSLDGVPLVMDTATVSRDFGARPGSTVITIWERTLKEKIKTDGEHSAEVIFDDGTAVHKFTVRGTGSGGSSGGGSSSGGSSSGGGGCATMGAALAVITAIALIKRRKR